jgi:hypothetical protein
MNCRQHNRGWFKRGQDIRRHALTPEERRRGGMTTWIRTMASLRVSMNLPLPSPELRRAAQDLVMTVHDESEIPF